MHQISRSISFRAAHRVPSHEHGVTDPHFHKYTLTVYVRGTLCPDPEAPDYGMVIDLGELQSILDRWVSLIDGKTLLWSEDEGAVLEAAKNIRRLPVVPTAESLASWAYQTLVPQIERGDRSLYIHKVKLKVFGAGDSPVGDGDKVWEHVDGKTASTVTYYRPSLAVMPF